MYKFISYIGSKVKLFDFLEEIIFSKFDKNDKEITFYDLFAGTNAVNNYVFKTTNWNIVTNDFSNYSYILSHYLEFQKFSFNHKQKLKEKLIFLDKLPLIKGDIYNEFSIGGIPKSIDKNIYKTIFYNQPYNSRMFFSSIVGMKIDTIKEGIKTLYLNKEITKTEQYILLIFLLYYVNNNSNTTSIFGAYLKSTKKIEKETLFLNSKIMILFEKDYKKNNLISHLKMDTEKLSNKFYNELNININKNIIYLDPPYSTRSYESNYHILDYIVDFNFNPLKDIKYNSKTAQFNNRCYNSFAKKGDTLKSLENIIYNSLLISNHIFISYNSEGLIKEEQINNLYIKLKKKYIHLKLYTYTKDYKKFKAAKSNMKKESEEYNRLLNKKDKNNNEKELLKKLKNKLNNNKEDNKTLKEIIWYFRNEG